MRGWRLGLCLWLATTPAFAEDDDKSASTDANVEQQETTVEETETSADQGPAPVYEIEVISEEEVRRLRNDVERAVEGLGYRKDGWRRGYEVYLHPVPWKPEVWISQDGMVRLKRRRVHFRLPEIGGGAWGWVPVRALACVVAPTACVRVGGQVISDRKLRWHKEEVVTESYGQVVAWQDAIATNATNALIDGLPTQLDALWEEGVHPESGELVETMEARRQIILEMWVHRADNRWGLAVREAIGLYLKHVLQDSPHPVTDEELADVNARRAFGPALVL